MGSNRGAAFDPIAVVEAAYRLDADEGEWLAGLASASKSGIDQGLGVYAASWRRASSAVDVSAVRGAMAPELIGLVPRTFDGIPHDLIRRHFTGPPQVVRVSDEPDTHRFFMDRFAGSARPIGDTVGGLVGDGHERGVTIAAFAEQRGRFEPAQRRSWVRLMSHVGAGLRLRGKLEDERTLRRWAILDPHGRVHHAEAPFANRRPRESLVAAVRAIERARGGLRRTRPDEALAMWTALVSGRWSVIDWIDTDGRRYLVAHENDLVVGNPRALTRRERQVVEYLIHGRSNAEIAYALGVAESNVNRTARDALRKLGGARRTDLAALFAPQSEIAVDRPDRETVVLRAADRSHRHWGELAGALREVVAMAVGGASNDEIALARGRSVRTVANQLAGTYARFGVRGRAELASLLGPPPAAPSPSD
ncbi:MAG: helix-turn-helix transcriptional regulator [Polyangiaceae bacterium]|nr:helix-turn-helix transcriptional regulator [Polyangiaceae bacterium]